MSDMKYIVCIIILALILVFVLIKLIILKLNIKTMREELSKTKDENYNRNVRVGLLDKNLEMLAAEINKNLDYQRGLKKEAYLSRKQLEQSISDIAHDLRTPLTVVKGNLQMLEKESLSEKGREYLEVSSKKAATLKSMVDEFFELSVLESDSSFVELKELDVIAFLTEFVIENEAVIRQNNLTPEISFPEKGIIIKANKDMMNRVFSNLIGNILKYAKDSFELSVEEISDIKKQLGSKAGACHIRIGNKVEDVSAIDIDHIFDRTYRADKARSDGSAGLGLYIAKLLVEKQKGSLSAVIEGDKLYFDILI